MYDGTDTQNNVQNITTTIRPVAIAIEYSIALSPISHLVLKISYIFIIKLYVYIYIECASIPTNLQVQHYVKKIVFYQMYIIILYKYLFL